MALIVLGIMVAMAGGGLVLALATQQFRRNNDFRRGATPNIVIQPPSEWPALGYLPRDTNVIAGVHVAGLKHDPLGKRFFELPRPPVFDLILEAVEQFAHVKPDGIDHVVFGAEVTSKLPQFVFAVRTVTRFDADELSKGLAAPKLSYRGHTAFRLPMKPASGLLYCPDERTLVGLIRLDPVELKDLEEIPAPPRNGCEGLSATLVEALTRHLDKQSLAFAAGDLEKAAALRDFLGFTTLRPAAADALAGVRWFGLALYPQDGWTLSGAFFTGDASSAQVLHAFLKGLNFTGAGSVKLTGPHAEEPAPQARLVQLQVRAGPEGFQELLRTVRLPLPK